MDAFSEILSGLKLNGALYFSAEFSAPWSFSSPPSTNLSELFALGGKHLVIYHFLIEGNACLKMPGGHFLELEPGDVVVLPHGDAHEMTSGRGATDELQSATILARIKARDLSPVKAGGGGKTARFACGYMACDPYIGRPILNGLPPMFKVNIRTDRSGQWLESSILHLVGQAGSGEVGSAAMLSKLSEALFVDTLRRYIAALPEQQVGWLAGTRDPVVGRSLELLHSRVTHPWTIADLADAVGISRSALIERFTRYLAEPPMTYLTRWRLQLAARSLEMTPRGIAEIAAEVGYESEAAFNRAFKREFGDPPGKYRRDKKRTVEQKEARTQARANAAHER